MPTIVGPMPIRSWHVSSLFKDRGTTMFTVLLLLGFICFGVVVPRVNFIALGLAFWILVPLLQALGVRG